MTSAQAANDPWAWLGLLKWSLNYVDGTKDNSDLTPMSDEDRAFLEKVMKEGIIDENERMKVILQEATKAMESYQRNDASSANYDDDDKTTEDLEELLQELRDIVEQIDYARAFCSMKGLPFLLGCLQQETNIPMSIRGACAGVLSTLAQNNPHVQRELLELGACKIISDVFFASPSSMSFQAKLMQAMSSMVRNHAMAEQVFCSLQQAPTLFMEGLNGDNQSLQSKTLFFLKALLTADDATAERIKVFQAPVIGSADNFLLSSSSSSSSSELREMTISLWEQLLQRQLLDKAVVTSRKDALAAQAVQRVSQIRAMTDGEEKEFAQSELEHWESFLTALARLT